MATFRGMRFCKGCDNMLQPKEQRTEQDIARLIYDCRICGYFEKAKPDDEADHCVYRSSEPQQSASSAVQAIGGAGSSGEAPKFFFHVDKECVKDPTLSRRKDVNCPRCEHNEAVTFMNPTKDRMNLIFVCTKCTYYWRKEQPKKGEEVVFSSDEEEDD
jgi:DNA-directed RNA polymerase II subunit RPB9